MKNKLPKDPRIIKKIEKWLSITGNSPAKLAMLLGYKSSSTIHQWIARGRVAEREKANLIEVMK